MKEQIQPANDGEQKKKRPTKPLGGIVPCPITKAAALAMCAEWRKACEKMTGKICRRWLRSGSRVGVLLAHGMRYESRWQVARVASLATARKVFERERLRRPRTAFCLVALAYHYTEPEPYDAPETVVKFSVGER
jgi:hypothetical protein